MLNFIWGFLPAISVPSGSSEIGSTSLYALGPGYLCILFLIAGLLALAPVLPTAGRHGFVVAAMSVGAALGALVTLIAGNVFADAGGGKGIGLILLLIFVLVQAVAAVLDWLRGAGGGSRPAMAATAPHGGIGQQVAPHSAPAQYGGRGGEPRHGAPAGWPAASGMGADPEATQVVGPEGSRPAR